LSKNKIKVFRQIPMTGELTRKIIHLCSLSIPIGLYYLPYKTVLWILFPVTAVAFFVDYGRYYIGWLNKFFLWFVGPILRPHERDTTKKLISGGSFVLISACICVLVFPKIIAITAFAILIISDASSAIIGRTFGKHHFLDKSLEGTLAFITTSWIVVAVTPKVAGLWQEYALALVAATIGGVIEAASVSLHVDDNFSVPLSIGIVMWLGYYFLSVISPSTFDPIYTLLVG
jgi:dolichol kinase